MFWESAYSAYAHEDYLDSRESVPSTTYFSKYEAPYLVSNRKFKEQLRILHKPFGEFPLFLASPAYRGAVLQGIISITELTFAAKPVIQSNIEWDTSNEAKFSSRIILGDQTLETPSRKGFT